jgi:AraC-like DNA-binding protein
MNLIQISDLQSGKYAFHRIVVFEQEWRNNESYRYIDTPRPNNGLIYITCQKAVFAPVNGPAILACQGDVLLLPKGSSYTATFYTDGNTEIASILVNFDIRTEAGVLCGFDGSPKLVPNDPDWKQFFSRMAHIYRSRTYPHLELTEALCQFFLKLNRQRPESTPSPIYPVLSYMDHHLHKELYIPELAKSAGMSESVFRKVFRQHTGQSPAAYITAMKIRKAKELLSSQDITLDQISALLGFFDTAYFCKVFKKETGLTPTQYKSRK